MTQEQTAVREPKKATGSGGKKLKFKEVVNPYCGDFSAQEQLPMNRDGNERVFDCKKSRGCGNGHNPNCVLRVKVKNIEKGGVNEKGEKVIRDQGGRVLNPGMTRN